ncbi:MAG: ABC transporter substrate-binding protein [Acidiferrobacterales bacterium]|jgi:NitT/TauT family transport system substrate-binding protein|nr:ABC transporter substrate-binding protein [Acidiferrobacterales bacterium]
MAKISITALRHSAFYTPLLITIAGGHLERVGLDPEYQPATPERPANDRLRSGECHVSQSAVATSFASLEQGVSPDIVHFAQINARDGFFIAGRDAEPDFSWKHLKGKRVLVDHFFQPLAMFRFALKAQGMVLDDIQVIDAGDVSAIEQAFRNGDADYVHLQGPAPQQLEQDGLAHVVASVGEAVGPVAFSSLCATRAWLDTEMALAFMQAYQEGLAFAVSAPADELAAMEQSAGFFTGIDRQVLSKTIATYQALGCWRTDPTIRKSEYERLLDVFMYSGDISRRHTYESVIVPPPGYSGKQ